MELMSPIDSLFLSAESREHPLHVAALQLFSPPADAGRNFVRETYQAMLQCNEVAPLFRKRPMGFHGAFTNLAWSSEHDIDLGYHVRRSGLPGPGRVRELLELTSHAWVTHLCMPPLASEALRHRLRVKARDVNEFMEMVEQGRLIGCADSTRRGRSALPRT